MIDGQGRVVHELRLAHSPERVWRALVEPDEIAQWLMPNDFAPAVGHCYHYDAGPPRGRIDAEVLAVEPPSRLQMHWQLDGVPTLLTITLRPDGDGTALHLVHERLTLESRRHFDDGWAEKFDQLGRHLENAP